MEIKFTEDALNKIKPKLDDHTVMLLSYADGVGPYSHHGLVALQIEFDFILITDKMDKKDYDGQYDSELGPIYYKSYSKEFLSYNLKIAFQSNFNVLTLSDDSETIEDNLQLQDLREYYSRKVFLVS